jgi:hypothetical protein
MIGAALVPVGVIIVLLLLQSEGGLFKAVTFVGGQILVRLAQGIAFGSLLSYSAVEHNKSNAATLVSTLVLVAGILLWITAIKQLSKAEDPDAPQPQWMTMFNSISAGKVFLVSVLWMIVAAKEWIFTLGALGIIREGDLPNSKSVLAFLIFIIGAESLVLAPILLAGLAPKQSFRILEISNQWLERNNRRIVTAVSVIFGTYFIFKGIKDLLG